LLCVTAVQAQPPPTSTFSLGTGVGGAIILDVELAPTRGSQWRGIRWVPATSTSTSGELLLILPSPTL
jgi:hypothetical protein